MDEWFEVVWYEKNDSGNDIRHYTEIRHNFELLPQICYTLNIKHSEIKLYRHLREQVAIPPYMGTELFGGNVDSEYNGGVSFDGKVESEFNAEDAGDTA